MDKFEKISETYGWVDGIENKVIIEFKKTYDIFYESIRRFFNNHNTSETKFNVLLILYKGPDEGLMLSDIGDRMLVTKGNITGLIDRLEKEGLVRRIRDNVDRRKVMAVITDKGKEVTKELMDEYSVWSGKLLLSYSDKDKELIIEVLKNIQDEIIKTY